MWKEITVLNSFFLFFILKRSRYFESRNNKKTFKKNGWDPLVSSMRAIKIFLVILFEYYENIYELKSVMKIYVVVFK